MNVITGYMLLFHKQGYSNPISQIIQSNLITKSLDTTSHMHVGNCFTGLCTKHSGYNMFIAARSSRINGVAKRFDCSEISVI